MKLKDSVLNKIRKDKNLRIKLMQKHQITEYTLLRWLRENDEELIKLSTLELISHDLDIPVTDMIIRENVETIQQT